MFFVFRAILFWSIIGIISTNLTYADAPHKFSYQAVIRDTDGELVINGSIGMQISILQGSPDGNTVFSETHQAVTNDNGLVSVEIGDGTTIIGSMEEINWAEGPYFIHTETDLQGGTNYTLAHTSELLSVPYALHSQTAKTLSEEILETDPVFMDSPAAGILQEDLDDWDEAFLWGDHAQAGYLKEEVQNLADVAAIDNSVRAQIKELSDPTDPQDAVTKAYVDLLKDHINTLIDRITALEIDAGFVEKDIDGNLYKTVRVGNQIWMAENLRVTKYNNGDDILSGINNEDWENLEEGAFAVFPHETIDGLSSEAEVVQAYGKLYNWYAIDDDRNICPEGWHVPDKEEWAQLLNFLKDEFNIENEDQTDAAGNALKSCRQVDSPFQGCNTSAHPRWESHDTHHGFDKFGFSAFPGGLRYTYGGFNWIGFFGYWWSSTEFSSASAWQQSIRRDSGVVQGTNTKKTHGYSVRCVRDVDN